MAHFFSYSSFFLLHCRFKVTLLFEKGHASTEALGGLHSMWYIRLDNNNKSTSNMLSNTFRGKNASCQKGVKRSAFNRWVSLFFIFSLEIQLNNKIKYNGTTLNPPKTVLLLINHFERSLN